MKRAIIDLSSVLWTCGLAGKDKEFGKTVMNDAGKEVFVNSASWFYENSVNHLIAVMDEIKVVPRDMILVMEGKNSKADRQALHPGYKAGRDKVEAQYEAFNTAKQQLLNAFLGVGAQVCWQDGGVEADDVIGYLAKRLKGERIIVSGDKDLAQLVGTDPDIHHLRAGVWDANPFGDFPHHLIPVCIALVGDSDDRIPGAKGFGKQAFESLLGVFGVEGLEAMEDLIKNRRLRDLEEDVGELKVLQKVIDDADGVYMSYELGRLRTERVNTLKRPLQWQVGMVKPREQCEDERLRKYAGTTRIVHFDVCEKELPWLRQQFSISPEVALDVETSTPPESDEWLAMGDREDKVDVLGSELTSLQLTFGRNMEHTVYLPVDNVPVNGCRNLSVERVANVVDLIPREKITWVHNAGFELPVCYNAWGHLWQGDQRWHGFLRNVRDSRLAGHYADENRSLHLKSLSKELLGYEQTTYQQATTKTMLKSKWVGQAGKVVQEYMQTVDGVDVPVVDVQFKMNELTASEVVDYGADDTICTSAVANHFRTVMEIEDTWHVFERVETLPAYVQAKAFVDGIPFSLERMRAAEKDDDKKYDEAWTTLRDYLISIGFEGTVCPQFTEISLEAVFEAYLIVLGQEFPNKRLRKLDKIAKLIRQDAGTVGEDLQNRAAILATTIEDGHLGNLNYLVKLHFRGEPALNLGSPKQMKALLYDHLGLPVNWVNDITDIEKQKNPDLTDAISRFKKRRAGSKEVTIREEDRELLVRKAKTNDVAIQFALAFDEEHVNGEARKALKALGVMKKVMTRRSLFYKKYWHARHWKTGKIHPNILQCGAVTRRPTGSDPNPYQWPKKGEGVRFRENILPHHKDAVVVSIDWAGQELRLAAERSQDANMLACYVGDNLKDPHCITAAGAMEKKWGAERVEELRREFGPDLPRTEDGDYELFLRLRALPEGHPVKKMADDLRKDGKNVNFTAQFGGQAPKIAERIIMRIEDAQIFLDARAEQFHALLEAAERAEEFCAKHGYALTMLGARRHLRDSITSDDRMTASRAERQAWNMEIQGSAGEMAKLAMARLWRNGVLHKYDLVFYVQVYDELVFSVHRDHAVDAIREVNAYMVYPYATMKVPILASISLGPDYGHQIECGDEFDEMRVRNALSAIFKEKESA